MSRTALRLLAVLLVRTASSAVAEEAPPAAAAEAQALHLRGELAARVKF